METAVFWDVKSDFITTTWQLVAFCPEVSLRCSSTPGAAAGPLCAGSCRGSEGSGRAAHRRVSDCGWWGWSSGWMLSHICDTREASPLAHKHNTRFSSQTVNIWQTDTALMVWTKQPKRMRLLLNPPVCMKVCFFMSDFWWKLLPQYWQG